MKIIINDGYENAKQLLYNEGLEDKREELNKFNFFKHVSNIPSQNYMHILYLIITICFFVVYVLSFATPGVFKQENLTFCRVSLILMCIVLFTLLFTNYRYIKKKYKKAIENQQKVSIDEYIEEIRTLSDYEILTEDYVIKELYDELNKINSLQALDVDFVEYAFVSDSDSDSDVFFFVKKKDGNKETFTFKDIEVEKLEGENVEERLVWDAGDITLYTKD